MCYTNLFGRVSRAEATMAFAKLRLYALRAGAISESLSQIRAQDVSLQEIRVLVHILLFSAIVKIPDKRGKARTSFTQV